VRLAYARRWPLPTVGRRVLAPDASPGAAGAGRGRRVRRWRAVRRVSLAGGCAPVVRPPCPWRAVAGSPAGVLARWGSGAVFWRRPAALAWGPVCTPRRVRWVVGPIWG